MIEYDKFYKSLRYLKLQNENYLTLDSSLPDVPNSPKPLFKWV